MNKTLEQIELEAEASLLRAEFLVKQLEKKLEKAK